MYYGFQALAKNQFRGETFFDTPGDNAIKMLGFDNGIEVYELCLILIGMYAFLVLAAFGGLWRSVQSKRQWVAE
jgi:hypothetical protein